MARGEIVIVVSGAPAAGDAALELDADSLLRALLQELPPSQAAKIAAHLTGGKRSELYEAALQIGRVAGPRRRARDRAPESARQSLRASVEESPGSQGKAPGNAWGARAHGKCNRK